MSVPGATSSIFADTLCGRLLITLCGGARSVFTVMPTRALSPFAGAAPRARTARLPQALLEARRLVAEVGPHVHAHVLARRAVRREHLRGVACRARRSERAGQRARRARTAADHEKLQRPAARVQPGQRRRRQCTPRRQVPRARTPAAAREHGHGCASAPMAAMAEARTLHPREYYTVAEMEELLSTIREVFVYKATRAAARAGPCWNALRVARRCRQCNALRATSARAGAWRTRCARARCAWWRSPSQSTRFPSRRAPVRLRAPRGARSVACGAVHGERRREAVRAERAGAAP